MQGAWVQSLVGELRSHVSQGMAKFFFFFFFFKVPIKLIDRSCHWGGVCKPSTHTFPRPHPCVFPAVGSSVPASLCCSSFPPAFLPLLSERYWLHPHPIEIPSFFQRPTTSFYRHSHIQDKTPPIWGSCSTCYTWGLGWHLISSGLRLLRRQVIRVEQMCQLSRSVSLELSVQIWVSCQLLHQITADLDLVCVPTLSVS